MSWISHVSPQENPENWSDEGGEPVLGRVVLVFGGMGALPHTMLCKEGRELSKTRPSVLRAPESGLGPFTGTQWKGPGFSLSALQEVWYLLVAIARNLEHK